MDVGVRELKARLSHYIERAAGGEAIVVTDRGRPVARLSAYTTDAVVDRGIEEGWIEAPRRTSLSSIERIRSERAVLDVLDEDRG